MRHARMSGHVVLRTASVLDPRNGKRGLKPLGLPMIPECLMANRAQLFNDRALKQMGVPPLESGIDGRGIVIGFVDYGFDVLHPCFREAETGRTRFCYLWDQNSGREFDANTIDTLINSSEQTGTRRAADAYYDPHANSYGKHGTRGGAHGTIMASIAAGSAMAGFRGVAPAADMIAVQVGLLDHHWKEENAAGVPTWASWEPGDQPIWNGWRSYDESTQIIDAIEYVYDRASRLGASVVVINLSIGAYSVAHDGRSSVEQKITEIVSRGNQHSDFPCAVVVSAGNAGVEENHFSGVAEPGKPLAFSWRMSREDVTQNKIEIWYRSDAPLDIDLRPELQATAPIRLEPGRTHPIHIGATRIGVADHAVHVRGPLSRARILLHPPFVPQHLWPPDSGELSFEIVCKAHADVRAPVHAWIERDDGLANRSTLDPCDPASTLASLAAAEGAIVVAAYDNSQSGSTPGLFPVSSLGPLPWDSSASAPHVCAPGHRIWGARSKSAGFIETSGTSAAAALTSGAVALLMQRFAHSPELDFARLGELLIGANRQKIWSPRFGNGAVNIAHILEEVTA